MRSSRRRFWGIPLLIGLVLGAVAIATAAGVPALAPLRLPAQYPWGHLASEADTIEECLECHESADMHTCASCHDEHGEAYLAELPFNGLLLLCGDVPNPGFIPLNDILPYLDERPSFVPLLDFLAGQGVGELESVTLASDDGGFVTFERDHLSEEAMLMSHVDGIRFAAENLHVSTWLKGIERMIVVGPERPLRIDGQETSIGRLLLGPTRSISVEPAEVMFKSETDGQIRRGQTAYRLEGAPLEDLVGHQDFSSLLVRDAQGQEHSLPSEEAAGAVLVQLRGQATLVLPERSRDNWIAGVVEIVSQP
ncbi:MAG: hypothetical protein JXA37_11940 [Chloroflexia bacterium]|nr:hypothetical protein [Chloroflexia bacterium]